MAGWRFFGVAFVATFLGLAACGSDSTDSGFPTSLGADASTPTPPPGTIGGNATPDGGGPPPASGGACTRTCTDLATTCGPTGDGCGNVVQCGTCSEPATCGGGGKASTCGTGKNSCKPKTCADFPSGSCGPLADGCGGLITCGSCAPPQFCGGGGTPSICGGNSGCTPKTTADCASSNVECGPMADGCGGFVDCGGCSGANTCGAGGPSKCGIGGGGSCTPKTCADLGFDCGPAGDGCGNLLNCGSCTAPQTCGGGGTPSKCGGTAGCVPRTCDQLGATCGAAGDGCGGTIQCGTCTAPQSCGGGGTPSVCGGSNACVPITAAACAGLGFNCGLIADGCGGTVQCGELCPNNGVCGASSPNVCSNTTATTGGTVAITSGTVPANPSQTFDPGTHTVVTTDATKVPTLVYPVNDTMFPQNIYRVLFQWNKKGNTLFQLSFTSATLAMSVYTDGVHATCTAAANGGGCWESAEDNWKKLAGANAGQDVTLKIRGMTSASATTIYESPAYTIHFSRQAVPGALYYWSTTVQGVRRGALGDAAPTNFLTPAEAQGKCVACHTVSRNGKRMAADVNNENLTVVNVSPTTPPPVVFGNIGSPPVTIANAWATFNPDTTRVVSSHGGVMTLRDGNTGAGVSVKQPGGATSATGIIFPSTEKVIQPDWSPDAAHLTFARGSTNDRQGGTSLAWVTAGTDAFSNIENIVTATAVGTNVLVGYPMFNPTSSFLAFVAGPKIDGDNLAQVWVVPASPSSAPQLLVRANTLVNDYPAPANPTATTCPTPDTRCIENNIPTWAPSGEPQLQWIAFNSHRDYGFVLRSDSKVGNKMQQLWITAIDVSKLGTGQDPSYPAFRVPFVELTENAHRPFWAEDAINPPTCVAKTCADFPGKCGQQSDGCGGVTPSCGDCTAPQTCGGGGTPSVCGGTGCTPRTCANAGATCGSVADGCGGLIDCGICVAPQTCGGAGTPNQCGNPACVPTTCAMQGFNCGPAGDGCGGLLDCGACTDPQICGGGGAPGVCGNSTCTPTTCSAVGASCGPIANGCGGLVDCGVCPPGQVCGGGGPSKCGPGGTCVKRTCADAGANCGPIGDGCGGSLDCGPCTVPGQTCGGGGTPNVCGGCTRTTCAAAGVECGPIGDGCGGLLDCGTCTQPGDSCGGGGVPFKCGQPAVK